MEVEAALPLPVLSEPSSLMDESHLRAVSPSITWHHMTMYSTLHVCSCQTICCRLLWGTTGFSSTAHSSMALVYALSTATCICVSSQSLLSFCSLEMTRIRFVEWVCSTLLWCLDFLAIWGRIDCTTKAEWEVLWYWGVVSLQFWVLWTSGVSLDWRKQLHCQGKPG